MNFFHRPAKIAKLDMAIDAEMKTGDLAIKNLGNFLWQDFLVFGLLLHAALD